MGFVKQTGRKRATSLTELMVVVVVILVLLSVLLISIDSVYSSAMRLRCQHRLEQIGYALQMYASAYQDTYPKPWDMYSGQLWYQTLVRGYLDSPTILACPTVGEPPLDAEGKEGEFDTGPRDNADPLLEALFWLKDKQEKSGTYKGRWSYKKEGTTTGWHSATTGLAILCFFGFGCTDRQPPEFAETLRSAVEYITSATAQQKTDASGQKGKWTVNGKTMYTQAICVMATCAAYRMCADPGLREKARAAAQLGFDYIVDRTPYEGAFGYEGALPWYNDYWRGDTSIAGWCYQAIAAARVAGLNPTNSTWAEVNAKTQRYLTDHCMDSKGRSSYWYNVADPRASDDIGVAMTPISLTARMLNGGKPGDTLAKLQADWLVGSNRHIQRAILRDGKNNYHLYYKSLALFRMGGDYWSNWYKGGSSTPSGWTGYPDLVLKHKQPAGTDSAGNPMAFWEDDTCIADGCGNSAVSGLVVGRVFTTAIAALTLEAAFEEHWIDPSWTPAGGRCSYGYNNRLGTEHGGPAADTILVMDYGHWQIDHDTVDVESNDDESLIALRHSGKANALLGDGRVVPLTVGQIFPGMWTPERGD